MSNELSESSKNIIRVVFYHKIWEEGEVPRVWKEAVIVPVHRPGDDDTNPAHNRPTALTSHVCKIMDLTPVLPSPAFGTNTLTAEQTSFQKESKPSIEFS